MKKNIFMMAAILLSAFCWSCSSSHEPKNIDPTSGEFTSGELAKYIEVVEEPCELSYAENDGVIPTQYIRLKVTLELVKDGIKDCDPRDIDFTSLLSVATINLVDKDGSTINDLSIKNEDLLKLKKLLTGEEGDKAEITFEGSFNNHEEAPKWFENAVNFTPYLTGDIYIEGKNTESNIEIASSEDSSDESSEESFSSTTGSEDWDAILDEYDEFVTEYIKLLKKAQAGDMSAMTEYVSYMEKAQSLAEKLSNAESNMSAAQVARYTKIATKMASAAASM